MNKKIERNPLQRIFNKVEKKLVENHCSDAFQRIDFVAQENKFVFN